MLELNLPAEGSSPKSRKKLPKTSMTTRSCYICYNNTKNCQLPFLAPEIFGKCVLTEKYTARNVWPYLRRVYGHKGHTGSDDTVQGLIIFLLQRWLWTAHFCHLGHTFLIGEVGLVTWLVGLVGGDTVLLEVVVVLLLTDADGLVLSKTSSKDNNEQLLPPADLSAGWLAAEHAGGTCFSLRFGIFVLLLFAGAARFILLPLIFLIHLLWLQGLDAWGALLWLQEQCFFAETET